MKRCPESAVWSREERREEVGGKGDKDGRYGAMGQMCNCRVGGMKPPTSVKVLKDSTTQWSDPHQTIHITYNLTVKAISHTKSQQYTVLLQYSLHINVFV